MPLSSSFPVLKIFYGIFSSCNHPTLLWDIRIYSSCSYHPPSLSLLWPLVITILFSRFQDQLFFLLFQLMRENTWRTFCSWLTSGNVLQFCSFCHGKIAFHSFYSWTISHCVPIPRILAHLFTNGYLGWCHILAVVNSDVITWDYQASGCCVEFFSIEYIPKHEMVELYDGFIFMVLGKSILFELLCWDLIQGLIKTGTLERGQWIGLAFLLILFNWWWWWWTTKYYWYRTVFIPATYLEAEKEYCA